MYWIVAGKNESSQDLQARRVVTLKLLKPYVAY